MSGGHIVIGSEGCGARGALVATLARLPADQRWREVMRLSGTERHRLLTDFGFWAHAGQLEPAGDWRVWLIRAGRGFGKTRAGAEWVGESSAATITITTTGEPT